MSGEEKHLTRRRYLATTGLAATASITGCTSGGSDAESTSTTVAGTSTETSTATATESPTETTEATPSPTDTPEASFEVVSVNIPEKVEIGQGITITAKIKNTGNADGTWKDTLSARIAGEQWFKLRDISLEVPAGETKTWTSEKRVIRYVSELTYRFERAGVEFVTEGTPGMIPYGESFKSVDGLETTVQKVELKSYYEYQDYNGETAKERAGDGQQWAFVYLRSENIVDQPVVSPLAMNISIIAGNKQYNDVTVNKEEGAYDGTEINPGIVREGWIPYKIPASLSKSDFRVTWTDDNGYGSWTMSWSDNA